MDFIKGRPARPDKELTGHYELEEPLEMETVSRKIALPEKLEERGGFPVFRHQIDVNNHVNNCQYVQMALEVLPECGRAAKIRVEYKKSAVFGDTICPKIAIEEDRKIVELCGTDRSVFAVVEMRE